MKTLFLSILLSFASLGISFGGVANSPWSFDDMEEGWSFEDKDREIAEGVKIEFMVQQAKSSARLVAISAPVTKADNGLNEFAAGIRKSFARNGVIGLEEATSEKWGCKGLSMAFAIPSDAGQIACNAFFFEAKGKFWAAMAFGPERAKLERIFRTLKAKTIEHGSGIPTANAPESNLEGKMNPKPELEARPQ